jgi:glutamine synthetase
VDEDFFEEGFMFDGSSIAGWKSIDQSDMKLIPTASVYIDPFYAEKTLCVHCNVVEPDTGEPTAAPAPDRAEGRGLPEILGHRRHLFGPEAEFFLFDDVRYSVTPRKVAFEIDAGPCRLEHRHPDRGRQPWPPRGPQGRLFPGQPDRRGQDIAARCCRR